MWHTDTYLVLPKWQCKSSEPEAQQLMLSKLPSKFLRTRKSQMPVTVVICLLRELLSAMPPLSTTWEEVELAEPLLVCTVEYFTQPWNLADIRNRRDQEPHKSCTGYFGCLQQAVITPSSPTKSPRWSGRNRLCLGIWDSGSTPRDARVQKR